VQWRAVLYIYIYHAHIYIYMCTHIYIYIIYIYNIYISRAYIYIYVYIYIYYIYIYIYIFIYVLIYRHSHHVQLEMYTLPVQHLITGYRYMNFSFGMMANCWRSNRFVSWIHEWHRIMMNVSTSVIFCFYCRETWEPLGAVLVLHVAQIVRPHKINNKESNQT